MAGSGADLSQAYAAFSRGNLEESGRLCAAALARDARDASALHLAAAIALRRGDAALALGQIDAAIAAQPGDALKHQTRAIALRTLGRGADALADFREAMRLSPGIPDPHASLGLYAIEQGDLAAAVAHLDRALQLKSRSPDVFAARGALYAQQGNVTEAARLLEAAVTLDPGQGPAWNNLANAWRKMGRHGDAENAYRQAIARSADAAVAWQNYGNFLREQGRVPEAVASLERSIAANPDLAGSHFSLGIVLLQAGELARGWNEYAWRHGTRPDAGLRQAFGEALAKGMAIELIGEQGLGDMLFFLRWAALVPGARWRWSGDDRIAQLLEPTGLLDSSGIPVALNVRVGDLPMMANLSEQAAPPLPLRASTASLEAASAFLAQAGPPPYVAVAWRAGTASQAGEERLSKDLPPELLAAVLRGRPGTVVSVQRGARTGEREAIASALGRPAVDAGAFNDDLPAMAGLLSRVQRYVGVSSTNVHIAAGVGLPASILVPRPWEWRFGDPGPGSRWFPGFTIHHEDERGWAAAQTSLERELDGLWPRR